MDNKNISVERKKYLKKIKMTKISILGTQILILVGFIALWEILANIGVIDNFITSQPSRIVKTFMNLSSNNLLEHVGTTTFETIVGFLSGTMLGVLIAIILWWSKFLSKVLEPFLVVLNSLPKVALRTSDNYMGWGRYICNNNYGTCNFFNCYNTRNFKWIFEY